MRRRLAAAVVLAACALAPPVASAHGGAAHLDLLTGDASYPDGVPGPLRRALDGMLRDARGQGYAMKVALVQDLQDVQGDRRWLVEPQVYADYLSGLLRPGERVLTVHPGGLGGNALGEGPARALEPLQEATTPELDRLAVRAMQAVARLTAAHGTPVALPAVARAGGGGPGGGGGPPWWLVAGVPVVLVGAGLAGVSLAGRRRRGDVPAP